MVTTKRRRPAARLVLTLAALATLIAGYYLGQYWQRRPLAGLNAIVYTAPRPLHYPPGLEYLAPSDAAPAWRLFIAADTRARACAELLRHHAFVRNRLAAWPDIQSRLRLSLLAYDQPDAAAADDFAGAQDWVDVISTAPAQLDRLSEALGILPIGDDWCTPTAANAVLVSPAGEAWALLPHASAAIMAHDLRTIIAFVE